MLGHTQILCLQFALVVVKQDVVCDLVTALLHVCESALRFIKTWKERVLKNVFVIFINVSENFR